MKYRMIVADPPWKFGDKLRMSGRKRGAEDKYARVMTLQQLCDLPVVSACEEDAVLGLWFPAAFSLEASSLMYEWGFRQTQIWPWLKMRPGTNEILVSELETALVFGLGRLGRGCMEHVMLGVRGKVYQHVSSRSERGVVVHPQLPHSVKPENFQDKLERIIPTGERLELFARRQRPGWTCVGLEMEPSREVGAWLLENAQEGAA